MTSTWKPSGAGAREVKQAKWKFQDTVVLITGASQGQGRSHAETFANAGADLILCDLPDGAELPGVTYGLGSRSALDEVAGVCRDQGARVLPVACDVRDSD